MLEKIYNLIKKSISIKIFIIFILSLYSIIILLNISLNKELQHDLKTYYYAAKVYTLNKNPYNINISKIISNNKVKLNFIYPPIALYFFIPLTYFDYNTAHNIFLFLKFVFLVALIIIWIKILSHKKIDYYIFLLFCFVAFKATIFKDLNSGNITIFEQFFIWLSFYYFIKEKYKIFCALIIFIACFKLQPILFLFLLLFCENKYKYFYLFISFISFSLIHFILFIIDSKLLYQFLFSFINASINSSQVSESILHVIRYFYNLLNFNIINFKIIYLLYIFLISIFFIKINSKLNYFNIKKSEKNKIFILFFCSMYILIIPSVSDYSFILLILPTYYIIDVYNFSKLSYLLLIFSIVRLDSILNISMFNNISFIIKKFNNIFTALLVWFSYIYFMYNYDYIKNQDSITMDEKKEVQKST